jgi:hypothetical protein
MGHSLQSEELASPVEGDTGEEPGRGICEDLKAKSRAENMSVY